MFTGSVYLSGQCQQVGGAWCAELETRARSGEVRGRLLTLAQCSRVLARCRVLAASGRAMADTWAHGCGYGYSFIRVGGA